MQHIARKVLEFLPLLAFILACISFALLYGLWAGKSNAFPTPQVFAAWGAVKSAWSDVEETYLNKHWTINLAPSPWRLRVTAPQQATDRLRLLAVMTSDLTSAVRVVTPAGETIHEWRLNWFERKPDLTKIPEKRRPKALPGATVHGSELTTEGSLIVNFEHLSTMRIGPCGATEWALPNLGHHSVFIDQEDNIWVSGENYFPSDSEVPYDNYEAPLRDWVIEKISPSGEVLLRASIIDILEKNDLVGLALAPARDNADTIIDGDTLHLNDVEIIPQGVSSDILESGDIIVSLRNINTILVLDKETFEVKFRSTGRFLRQHDPDFVSDDKIVVFDNRNLSGKKRGRVKSRLLEVDASTGSVRPYFSDGEAPAFFTDIMGKQQILDNGNVLIVSAREGRVIEVTPAGRIAWLYENKIAEDRRGLVTSATVLPPEQDEAFFRRLTQTCSDA